MMGCLGSGRLHKCSKVVSLELTQIKSTGREGGNEKEKYSLSVGRKKSKLRCEFVG